MPLPDLAGQGALVAWALLLALALVAGLAYALGVQRARASARQELGQAQQALRAAQQLGAGWRWQTDASHQLVLWQAQGGAPEQRCALFQLPGLQGRLQSQQPFGALRLHCTQAPEGNQGWELSGIPRWTDSGVFDGFFGCAHPTDANDKLRELALQAQGLLAAWAGPALVLRRGSQGWAVHQANDAARALWPACAAGRPVADAAAALPRAVLAALGDGQPAAGRQDIDGWQLHSAGDAGSLLLVKPGAAAAPAPGAEEHERNNFSFTLSHDLRAPIRVVEGFTRIVKEDYGRLLDRVGNDHLDRVLGAAARMNLMIDALLTLARLSEQPLARQRVNLSQLAGYVVDDLRRSAPEREVAFDIAPGLVAQGDPTLLRLVLENLLGNAWKYSAKVPNAQIALLAHPHPAHPAFVVRDNGAGFDMRSAERLFGLFQRLHSASDFPGHGVGLASVRRIVQRHGGQIWAESEPGRGASFIFTLPD